MREPRSYVVRIYRQGFRTLSGFVEDTHTGGKRPFRDLQELSVLLREPISANPASGHKPKFLKSRSKRGDS
jgi:hypothetical protein